MCPVWTDSLAISPASQSQRWFYSLRTRQPSCTALIFVTYGRLHRGSCDTGLMCHLSWRSPDPADQRWPGRAFWGTTCYQTPLLSIDGGRRCRTRLRVSSSPSCWWKQGSRCQRQEKTSPLTKRSCWIQKRLLGMGLGSTERRMNRFVWRKRTSAWHGLSQHPRGQVGRGCGPGFCHVLLLPTLFLLGGGHIPLR